jgi:hypothetical protein
VDEGMATTDLLSVKPLLHACRCFIVSEVNFEMNKDRKSKMKTPKKIKIISYRKYIASLLQIPAG